MEPSKESFEFEVTSELSTGRLEIVGDASKKLPEKTVSNVALKEVLNIKENLKEVSPLSKIRLFAIHKDDKFVLPPLNEFLCKELFDKSVINEFHFISWLDWNSFYSREFYQRSYNMFAPRLSHFYEKREKNHILCEQIYEILANYSSTDKESETICKILKEPWLNNGNLRKLKLVFQSFQYTKKTLEYLIDVLPQMNLFNVRSLKLGLMLFDFGGELMEKFVSTLDAVLTKQGDKLEKFTLILDDELNGGKIAERENEKTALNELAVIIKRQKNLKTLKLFLNVYEFSSVEGLLSEINGNNLVSLEKLCFGVFDKNLKPNQNPKSFEILIENLKKEFSQKLINFGFMFASKTVDISSLIDHFQELINKKVFKEITDFDVVGYYGDYLNLTQNKKMNSQLKKLSETLSEQNIDHNYLSYIDEF